MTAPAALPPGTFSSILPAVEDVLELIYGIAEGSSAVTTSEVVTKAKEINSSLAMMKKAASSLPGGHLGTDAVVELTQILEEQAEQRRRVLLEFCETPTTAAEKLQ